MMTRETKVGLVIGLVFMVGVVYLLQWFTSDTGESPIVPEKRTDLAKVEDSRIKKLVENKTPLHATTWRLRTTKSVDTAAQKKVDETAIGKKIFKEKVDSNAGQSRPIVPKQRFYIVKEGQTLSDVAAAAYGATNGHEWQRIYEANKYKMSSPHIIRPGLKLLIPPLKKSEPSSTVSPLSLGGARSYTVMEGDMLSTISSNKLGTSRRWREILELNKDQLSDEFGLRPGMVLKLPR